VTSLSKTVGQAFYGQFRALREVQHKSILPVLSGSDVLVLSPTGSGKTEAVLAPLVQKHLSAARALGAPVILYITPTRALANDLLGRLERPLEALGLRAGIRHGERNDLQRASKPEVLITTPESLDVMLMAQEGCLREVLAVVLDEVHLTYNSQRGLQLGLLLRRLEGFLSRQLQVAALSATVATDAEIWRFFRPGRDVVTVRDEEVRPIDAQMRILGSAADLGLLLEQLSAHAKLKALVFAGSRQECDNVAGSIAALSSWEGRVFVHHSALSRNLRHQVEALFQEEASAICVATSTLELGIDIGDVDLVVLYGPPPGWESFLQRIGRGNRRGDKANVLCLASPGHGKSFGQLLLFETLVSQVRGNRLEQRPAMDLYGAAAQQLLSLVLERAGGYRRVSDLTDVFSAWTHLSRDVIMEIVTGLVAAGYLRSHGFLNRVGAGGPLHQLRDLGLVWGNFTAGSSTIPVRSSSRELGAIPVTNLPRIRPGVFIRFGGRRWRVRRVGHEGIEVQAAQRGGSEVEISYGGRRPPTDPTSVEGMLFLLRAGIPEPQMPPSTAQWFRRVVDRLRAHVEPGIVPFAHENGRFFYFTFAGRLMNEVVAVHLGSSGFRAGEVVLESADPIDLTRLPDDPRYLLPLAVSRLDAPDGLTVFQRLLPRGLLAKELGEFWLKSPVYSRSLGRLREGRQQQVELNEVDEINF